MMLLTLITSSALLLVGPTTAPRPCARPSAVEVDTTFDMSVTGPSRLLRQRSSGGPRYPVDLRNQRVQGDVHATFILDTLGRVVRGSAGILEESHPDFGESVCAFLRSVQFEPVLVEGRRVRVRLTDMRFQFATRGG